MNDTCGAMRVNLITVQRRDMCWFGWFPAHAYACAVFLPKNKEDVYARKTIILGTEKVGKLLKQFAIPCIFSLIISCLYNIVDQIFVGQRRGLFGQRRHRRHLPHYRCGLGRVSAFWRRRCRLPERVAGPKRDQRHSPKRWQQHVGFLPLRRCHHCHLLFVRRLSAAFDRRHRCQPGPGPRLWLYHLRHDAPSPCSEHPGLHHPG